MFNYIREDKLLDDIKNLDISDCTDIDDILTEVETIILSQPSADVKETKYGEWIPCGDGVHTLLMCSSCGQSWPFYKKRGSKFCPNCGASMNKFK